MRELKPLRLVALLVCFLCLAAPKSPTVSIRLRALNDAIDQLTLDYEKLEQTLSSPYAYDASNCAQGRLTVLSGDPVPVADQIGASTLYYTPHSGAQITLYDGTLWAMYDFDEVALALSGLSANTNYDVFLFQSAGTLTLELTAWASNTARSIALAQVDGINVRSNNTTRRYLGTIRTTSSTTTEDSRSRRFVWNYQNQVRRTVFVGEGTDSWTYAVDAWRSVRGSASNRIEVVFGDIAPSVTLRALLIGQSSAGTSNYLSTGIGIDSTTVNSAQLRGSGTSATTIEQVWGYYAGYPGLGYHVLNWLERSNATSITIYGDHGDGTKYQSGVVGEIDA